MSKILTTILHITYINILLFSVTVTFGLLQIGNHVLDTCNDSVKHVLDTRKRLPCREPLDLWLVQYSRADMPQ